MTVRSGWKNLETSTTQWSYYFHVFICNTNINEKFKYIGRNASVKICQKLVHYSTCPVPVSVKFYLLSISFCTRLRDYCFFFLVGHPCQTCRNAQSITLWLFSLYFTFDVFIFKEANNKTFSLFLDLRRF